MKLKLPIPLSLKLPRLEPQTALAAASAGLVALDSFLAPSPLALGALPRALPPPTEPLVTRTLPPHPQALALPSLADVSAGAELAEGSRGGAVTMLRGYLDALGYPATDSEADYFGPALTQAVTQFQRDHRLIAPHSSPYAGRVGTQTLAKIGDNLLTATAQGRYVIRPGAAGPHVAELQRLLTLSGYGVKATGIFGPTTAARMTEFKASRGLSEGPAVGPHTLAALRDRTDLTAARALGRNLLSRLDLRRLAATKPTPDQVRQVIEKAGGHWNPDPNAINILALRRPTNARQAMTGRYDDWSFVVFRGKVYALEMNTDPSGQYMHRVGWRPPQGVDADRNGTLDQGWRPEGYNLYYRGYSATLGRVMIPKKAMDLHRDINADGQIDAQDRDLRASDEYTILLHAGGTQNTYSAGCQTYAPAQFERLWALIGQASNADAVGYTLVDVSR